MSGTTGAAAQAEEHPSNAYELFILVLTVLSLGIMVAMLLPLTEETISLLMIYDNLVCVVFLADFAKNLFGRNGGREYFIHQRGWLDLLGSIPSLGILRYAALLRLARISRLVRISRLLRGDARHRARGRPRPQPRPVRRVHHRAVGVPRDRPRERARAPVRELRRGRQHRDRRRRVLVGRRDDHDRGLRRQVPRHAPRADHGARSSCSRAWASSDRSPASSRACWSPAPRNPRRRPRPPAAAPTAATDPALHAELVAIRQELAELRRSLDVADTA